MSSSKKYVAGQKMRTTLISYFWRFGILFHHITKLKVREIYRICLLQIWIIYLICHETRTVSLAMFVSFLCRYSPSDLLGYSVCLSPHSYWKVISRIFVCMFRELWSVDSTYSRWRGCSIFICIGDPFFLSLSVSSVVLLQFLNHPKTVGRASCTGDQPFARPLPTTQTQNKGEHKCIEFFLFLFIYCIRKYIL
jgi:hypothetical protein